MKNGPALARMLSSEIDNDKLVLNEIEGKKILRQLGITIPVGHEVDCLDRALQFARKNSFPLVLKGIVENLTHKSEHGLIRVDIKNEEELVSAYQEISKRCATLEINKDCCKILVEKQVKSSVELVVGLTTDRVFGKVLMFGLGGVFVELMKDVSFKICPITKNDVYDMIESLRCKKVFEGFRGQKPIDKEKIANFLLLFGGKDGIAGQFNDELDELEVNPAVVDDSGNVVALDVVLKLKPKTGKNEGKGSLSEKVDLDRFFSPKSIGIVGVSPDKPSLPKDFFDLLIANGYKGNIYPINHNHDGKELSGKKIYGKISDVPENIDYLYVSIPAKAVASVLENGKGKVRFAHIISSGFSETGSKGKELEKTLLEAAKFSGIRLAGPNCLGMFCPSEGIVFVLGCSGEPGGVSIISQSGGITTEVIRTGGLRGIKFHQAVSIGNSIDLGIEDFLEHMGADKRTKVIGIYAEAVKAGSHLPELLKEICKIKPVVIFKGGRSALGAKAASSHTGAMADNYGLWQAMCRQCGAVLVKNIKDFLNTILAFQSMDPTPDNSLFLVSHSGGLTVTGADLCEEYSLEMPELENGLQRELFSLGIPPGASIKNPVDIPIGTLSARIGPGEKLDILKNFYDYVVGRKNFGYDVLYLMTDNVMVSANGENIVKALFDLAIELGGFEGKRHRKFVLAVNSSLNQEFIINQCRRAANNDVVIYYDLDEALKSISSVVQYGIRFKNK